MEGILRKYIYLTIAGILSLLFLLHVYQKDLFGKAEYDIAVYNRVPLTVISATRPGPLLVDITAETLYTYQLNSNRHRHVLENTTLQTSQNNASSTMSNKTTHTILWFNKGFWIKMPNQSEVNKVCPYKNCKYTKDRKMMNVSSAVIFCISFCKIKQVRQAVKQFKRPANQVWVFWELEAPVTLRKYGWSNLPSWDNTVNWSMNFRLDSDIVNPIGFLKTRTILPERNYSAIFHRKTKVAAWVVSHCKTFSQREKFVQKLKEHGLSIDIYGLCGNNKTRLKGSVKEMITRDYKFYLGFENSLCSDYITEKYFRYYQADTILVVRGGADYKSLLPEETYINTADFTSFKQLVDFLNRIASSETLYTDYLRRKDQYTSHREIDFSYCQLCAKLNNLEENKKSYRRFPSFLESCQKPVDIQNLDTVS